MLSPCVSTCKSSILPHTRCTGRDFFPERNLQISPAFPHPLPPTFSCLGCSLFHEQKKTFTPWLDASVYFSSDDPSLARPCLATFLCQAEAVRARAPDGRLFYCALDHPGAQDDPCSSEGRSLPHISHWGFQQLPRGEAAAAASGSAAGSGVARERVAGAVGSMGKTVGDAVERQERTVCFSRSSLAFLQYGGGGRVGPSVLG